ncbi:MAG: response regulator [Chloroflexota bacterium]|nr:response regulator [Chloroflexota bacterium]
MDQIDTLSTPTVLLVESEDSLRRIMSVSISELRIRVLEAADLESALDMLKTEHPEVLVIEYDFPFGENAKLINVFRQHKGKRQGYVVVTTARRLDALWRRQCRPDATIYKPFDIRELCKTLKSLIEKLHPKHETSLTIDGSKV